MLYSALPRPQQDGWVKSSVLCVVKEARESEQEFRVVCSSDPPSFLPGLSLQAASGQEVYQVRENRTRRPAMRMLGGKQGHQGRDGGIREIRVGLGA